MNIRKATKKDFNEIGKLIKEEFIKPPYNEKWSPSASNKTLNHYFKIGYAYVAVIDKEIVGAIILREEYYVGGLYVIIEELIVSGKNQGKGIGKELIKKVESIAKTKKVHTIYLSANRKSNALKFYNKLGYKESKQMAVMGKVIK